MSTHFEYMHASSLGGQGCFGSKIVAVYTDSEQVISCLYYV